MTMRNITLSPARRAAILRSIRPRRARRLHWTVGRAVLAAVLAVLLTFSAFAAAIPALREALLNALGSFTEQSQPITGIVTEDNGIEVRPVAALSSSGMVRVWAEVQDKTGDRLSEDMLVDVSFSDMLGDATQAQVGHEIISYDEQTRTALIEVSQTGYNIEDGSTVSLEFRSFQPRENEPVEVGFPREMLSATGLKNMTSEMGIHFSVNETFPLVPEQTPATLPGTDAFRLSSVGFGEDGKLHIQIAFAEGVSYQDYLSTPRSTVSDPRDPDAILMLGGAPFEYNGIWYSNMAYDVDTDDLPYLTFSNLQGARYLREGATGSWQVTLNVEIADEVIYHPNVPYGNAVIDEIRVSEIGIYARAAGDAVMLGHSPTYAMTRSGEKIILTNNCVDGGWSVDDLLNPSDGGHSTGQWMFDTPIDPSEIVLLNFDGVDVPLQ